MGHHVATTLHIRTLLSNVGTFTSKKVADGLALIDVQTNDALEQLADAILEHALVEPGVCEACVGVCIFLRERYLHSPPECDGLSVAFTRILLLRCQSEYEAMVFDTSPLPTRYRACMQLIGHLYLRRLVALQVIAQITNELIGITPVLGKLPCEGRVECLCVLLSITGREIERVARGSMLLHILFLRLDELRQRSNNDNGPGSYSYSDALMFQIDELFALRNEGWPISKIIVQCMQEGPNIIKARTLSGEECASIVGNLGDMSIQSLREELAQELSLPASRLDIIASQAVQHNGTV